MAFVTSGVIRMGYLSLRIPTDVIHSVVWKLQSDSDWRRFYSLHIARQRDTKWYSRDSDREGEYPKNYLEALNTSAGRACLSGAPRTCVFKRD